MKNMLMTKSSDLTDNCTMRRPLDHTALQYWQAFGRDQLQNNLFRSISPNFTKNAVGSTVKTSFTGI